MTIKHGQISIHLYCIQQLLVLRSCLLTYKLSKYIICDLHMSDISTSMEFVFGILIVIMLNDVKTSGAHNFPYCNLIKDRANVLLYLYVSILYLQMKSYKLFQSTYTG
jgi:hypothetical protein